MNKHQAWAFILLALISTFVSCDIESHDIQKENQPKKTTDSVEVETMPDQISWDFEAIFVDSSFTKAILNAKRARIYNMRRETLLDSGLRVEFMSKTSGKRVSLLTADSARIDDETKNMLAKGNVFVVSDSSHTTLETSLLEWDQKTQKLYSTEYVKIVSPNEVITGIGFESDPNLNNYKIKKVSGVQK